MQGTQYLQRLLEAQGGEVRRPRRMSDFLVALALIGGIIVGITAEVIETEPEEWGDEK